jgi:hypothetical protein
MPARHSAAILVAAIALTALAGGCGGGDGGSDGSSTSDLPPVIVEIIEDAGSVTPDDGHVVKAAVGQEVQLNVSSDVSDEIHVHTTPDHEYEVSAGEDETFRFTVTSPGVYPIESHGLDITLVKLQVS